MISVVLLSKLILCAVMFSVGTVRLVMLNVIQLGIIMVRSIKYCYAEYHYSFCHYR